MTFNLSWKDTTYIYVTYCCFFEKLIGGYKVNINQKGILSFRLEITLV